MKKTFEDLEFKEHIISKETKTMFDKFPSMKEFEHFQDMLDAKQAFIEFDNGIKLSVIIGKCFYSNGIDTYEAMEINGTKTGLEPQGYLTVDELNKFMSNLQDLPDEKEIQS
jgi:hypothetical protein